MIKAMTSENKQGKTSQKPIMDFTLKQQNQSVKQNSSTLSPVKNITNKKQRNLQPSMDTNVQPESTLTMDGQSQNEEGQALKGALDP